MSSGRRGKSGSLSLDVTKSAGSLKRGLDIGRLG